MEAVLQGRKWALVVAGVALHDSFWALVLSVPTYILVWSCAVHWKPFATPNSQFETRFVQVPMLLLQVCGCARVCACVCVGLRVCVAVRARLPWSVSCCFAMCRTVARALCEDSNPLPTTTIAAADAHSLEWHRAHGCHGRLGNRVDCGLLRDAVSVCSSLLRKH